jgi:hypothetical protein
MDSQITLYIKPDVALPDNRAWTNRFEIRSERSSRIYIVSQHKTKRHWACSCPAWLTRRVCKHLDALGLPNHERPYEPKIEGGSGAAKTR